MPYSDCQIWENPAAARLSLSGPLLRDHPDVRALMVCETCGQRWLYDFLDSADWGGDGRARVVYAPVPEAADDATCKALSPREVEALCPRLVVHDFTTAQIDRVH